MAGKKEKASAFVVNNDPIQLKILTGFLDRAGLEVYTFQCAEDGFDAMNHAEPPGLVVTGLSLPGMDGWRFCRLLRSPEYAAFNDVPIIAVSAAFAGIPSDLIVDIGADAFLSFPVDEEEFDALAQNLLEGRAARRKLHALIVEEDEDLANLLVKVFSAHGFVTEPVHTADDAEGACERTPFDLIVLDPRISGGRGEALIDILQEGQPDCVLLVAAEDPTPELALSWMKRGVSAYLRKPFDPESLIDLFRRARRERILLHTNDQLDSRTRDLQASEEKYRVLFNSFPSGVTVSDQTGSIVESNFRAEELLGIRKGEHEERTIDGAQWHIIRPDGSLMPAGEYASVRALNERRQIDDVEMGIVKPGGDTTWINVSAAPLNLEGSGVVITYGDISERKRAEDDLRESEARYRSYVENAPYGVFVTDRNGRYLDANPAASRITGYSELELLSMSVSDLLPPESREAGMGHFQRVLEKGLAPSEEIGYRHANGEKRYWWISAVRVNENRFIGFVEDITEFREVQEETRRFRIISDNAVYGKAIADLEGNLEYVNPFFASIHGYVPEDLIGKNLSVLHSREQMDAVEDQIAALMSEESFTPTMIWHLHRDGTEFPMLMSGVLLRNENGIPQSIAASAIDMTNFHTAEQALRESEEKYRKAFITSPDSININRLTDGLYLEVNEGFLRILGYERDQVIGRTSLELNIWNNPEDRKRLVEGLRSDGYVENLTAQFLRADGSIREGLMSARVIDLNGEKCILSITRDITEPRRAEIQLREKTELLQNITDHMFDLVAMTDLDGRYTYVGPSHRMLGYEPEQFIGTSVLDYVHPEDAAHISDELARFLISPTPETTRIVEYRQRCADGSYRWLETMGKILFNEDGDPSSLFFSTRNVTVRKKWEEVIRESNRRLEAFLQMSQGITSSFNERELMQAIVDNATEAINITSGALYLLTEPDRIHLAATTPALPEDFPDEFRSALLKDHPHIRNAVETRSSVIMADSKTADLTQAEQEVVKQRHLRSNLYLPIVLRGRSIGVLILSSIDELYTFTEEGISLLQGFANQAAQVFENIRNYEQAKEHAEELELEIAERRRAEEEREKLQAQLTQAQKMESVGRLAGGVAHDFNNMLGVILGRAELALEQVSPGEPLHTDLEEIQKAAERSADLTRKLLTFARKQTVAPRVLDLNNTVESMLKLLQRLIGEDIDLTWKPGRKVWPVRMDPSQVDQILANLCVNARDAIDGLGKITIETDTVVFDQEYCARNSGFIPGEYVLLAVSDDGCGMDRETLHNIFDPFFTTKEMGKGTGLGLASVYGAVKQNQGFINVYSEPDQGTTFRIYLKRHSDGPLQEMPERTMEKPVPGSETILLVEDESAILEITTIMLKRLGYTVLPASTPGEAILLAGEHTSAIDLLLTDVVMPEMNGRDLAERLKTIHPEIKPLFTSGYTANVISHHGVLDEGVHFIQKPFSIKDMAAKIRVVLEG